ncbi:hypothetical protein GW17_00031774 [Ensete ventricosum]|nr:hypothetical protein GW17_00031774 [Ensete ventricosum]
MSLTEEEEGEGEGSVSSCSDEPLLPCPPNTLSLIRQGKSFLSFCRSFAGLGFLSWYLAGKIKAFDRQGHIAKLCIVFLPLLCASLIAISRVDDYWHHWQDVFAGGFLGLF